MLSDVKAVGGVRPAYSAYVVGALFVIYTFNTMDRALFGIVQEPIKQHFKLSDFELGLIGGPAFAFLYALCGVPLARVAERANRVSVISICFAAWSAMTMLCGMAGNFIQLFLARMGVGVGEAGCTPAAHSLITDYVPPHRRATSLAIYSSAASLGGLLAGLVGGLIAHHFGWRAVFLYMGAPGVLLAVVLKLTVREPPRVEAHAEAAPDFRSALALLWRKHSYRHVVMVAVCSILIASTFHQYQVSYLIRSHGMPLGQAASSVGLFSLAGGAGTLLSGFIVDFFSRRHPSAVTWVPALSLCLAGPLFIFGYSSGSAVIAVTALFVGTFFLMAQLGPMFTIPQFVAPRRIRPTATAVLLLVGTLVGQGVGVPVMGALSDLFAANYLRESGLTPSTCLGALGQAACFAAEERGLKLALIVCSAGPLLMALHYALMRRTFASDREYDHGRGAPVDARATEASGEIMSGPSPQQAE